MRGFQYDARQLANLTAFNETGIHRRYQHSDFLFRAKRSILRGDRAKKRQMNTVDAKIIEMRARVDNLRRDIDDQAEAVANSFPAMPSPRSLPQRLPQPVQRLRTMNDTYLTESRSLFQLEMKGSGRFPPAAKENAPPVDGSLLWQQYESTMADSGRRTSSQLPPPPSQPPTKKPRQSRKKGAVKKEEPSSTIVPSAQPAVWGYYWVPTRITPGASQQVPGPSPSQGAPIPARVAIPFPHAAPPNA